MIRSIKRCKKVFLAVILLLFTSQGLYAEYNHELGVTGGTAFYLGDANHITPFHRSKWSVGIQYRYNIDTRWALKLGIQYAEVEGNSADFGYVYPNGQTEVKFERGFVDAHIACEFNFLDIGQSGYYKARYKATPYILLGVGLTAYNDLYTGSNMYKFSIPFGIGGKWKINRRWTLGIEWTIHKLFVDDFDVTNADNQILNDPYQTGKVGFFDTDFYSIANLYITFNLFDENKFCR